MGWMEVLKELLKLFPQLIRDLPAWAKVVLTFGIFLLVAVLAIASLKLLIVYDIEVLEKPSTAVASGGPYNIYYENTERETKTDESGRAKLVSPTSIFDRQENRIVIKKPVVNVGENPLRAPYAFASKFWQSQMASFTLTCDFRKGACEREKTGQFQDIQERPKGTASRLGTIVNQAYAQAREASPMFSPKELVAPTIQTLMRVAPDGGYTEVRFTKLMLASGYCKKIGRCPDTLIADVEWNGIRLVFDGIEPWVSRERNLAVTEEGQVRGELLVGIENNLFGEGPNSLKVSFYSRGGASTTRQSPIQQEKPQLALV